MLTPESITPGAEKKMVGSVFICEAESLESVRKLMENDVYYTSGVVSPVSRETLRAFTLIKPLVVGQREAGHITLSSCHCQPPYTCLNVMSLESLA